jgi:hypothetical protein
MSINWSSGRGTCTIAEIKEVELRLCISFPEPYVTLVTKANGAYPDKKVFDIEGRKSCVFESLINWDKSRKANFYFFLEIISNKNIIPFGKDPFGNLICFDFSNTGMTHIVFWNHENEEVSYIANSFESFLENLRD